MDEKKKHLVIHLIHLHEDYARKALEVGNYLQYLVHKSQEKELREKYLSEPEGYFN
jgi:hypothetical protein